MESTSLRARFWIEAITSALALALLCLTLVNAEWIEELTGLDPDGGNGSLEWLVVAACGVVALAAAALARREWRRTPEPV